MTTSRQTFLLPTDLTVTVLRLADGLTAATLRAMIAAEVYVLCGQTRGPGGIDSRDDLEDTGYGCYVGTSDALRAHSVRVGVSLRTWTYRLGRLDPDSVVLVRGTMSPIDEPPRLLIEAGLARAVSRTHTILNTRTAAPTAATKAARSQRLWANQVTDQLAGLLHREVLDHHEGRPTGGSTREQLIRLVLAHGAMDVDDLLRAAERAGIPIPGATPAQRSRRDVTTRELSSGRPRVYRTHISRRAVVYPASMSLRAARQAYQDTRRNGSASLASEATA